MKLKKDLKPYMTEPIKNWVLLLVGVLYLCSSTYGLYWGYLWVFFEDHYNQDPGLLSLIMSISTLMTGLILLIYKFKNLKELLLHNMLFSLGIFNLIAKADFQRVLELRVEMNKYEKEVELIARYELGQLLLDLEGDYAKIQTYWDKLRIDSIESGIKYFK